jgi:hypothetical protein
MTRNFLAWSSNVGAVHVKRSARRRLATQALHSTFRESKEALSPPRSPRRRRARPAALWPERGGVVTGLAERRLYRTGADAGPRRVVSVRVSTHRVDARALVGHHHRGRVSMVSSSRAVMRTATEVGGHLAGELRPAGLLMVAALLVDAGAMSQPGERMPLPPAGRAASRREHSAPWSGRLQSRRPPVPPRFWILLRA